jgi:hypothetical protein
MKFMNRKLTTFFLPTSTRGCVGPGAVAGAESHAVADKDGGAFITFV